MPDIDHAAILRHHADTRRRGHSVNPEVLRAAADEIERLRAERDEARREVCVAREAMMRLMFHADVAVSKEAIHRAAMARGWDCFKEATDE